MSAAGQCKDLVSTADYLGFAPQHIFYLVGDPSRHYVRIEIPKNSNPDEVREIDIPSLELKGIQRAIHRKVLAEVPVGDATHSYVPGRSILTAAKQLCPAKAVLKVDIQDFFPSITFKRVLGLFKSLDFNDKTAFVLTRLTTMDNRIAQGAPTSPTISNLIVRSLDKRLLNLAAKWELGYVRYSDDMFFYKDKNFNHSRLAQIVYEVVKRSGFDANTEKTRYHPNGLPRITLGLLTHGDHPRIPGPQRRVYRSLFFKASRNIHWAYKNQEHLRGVLEWYKSVNGRDDTYLNYRSILDNVARLRLHDSYQSR